MPMKNGIESRVNASDKKTRYRGTVKVDGSLRRGPWGSHAEAVAWRSKALGEKQAGTTQKTSALTLRAAWDQFHTTAKAGTGTRAYKPGTLKLYDGNFKNHIDPVLGVHRISDIKRVDLQAHVDRWAAEGIKPGTISNYLDPVRAVYRWAIRRDLVSVNPTTGLDMPQIRNRQLVTVTKEEAAALLAALPDADRALWATAFYTGLRRGELRALRWSDADITERVIRVKQTWDPGEDSPGPPKSPAALRKVAIPKALLPYLEAHQRATGRSGNDLVFGRTATEPFPTTSTSRRADKAWSDAELERITLHVCRHSFASWMIAADANIKQLSGVMGHESIVMTLDRYGHLLPGAEAEVGAKLDRYLDD